MNDKKHQSDPCCPPKPALKDRPLLSPIQAGGLAAVFKVLANDTRLRLLHALVRADELCVTDLAAAVGMKPQAVSNQLQRLSDLGILAVPAGRQQHLLPSRGPVRAVPCWTRGCASWKRSATAAGAGGRACCESEEKDGCGRLAAEVFGTFALVFAGTGAIVINDASGGTVSHVGIALTFGLIVLAMIYAVGDVSGADLNPAVTLGFFAARRFEGRGSCLTSSASASARFWRALSCG